MLWNFCIIQNMALKQFSSLTVHSLQMKSRLDAFVLSSVAYITWELLFTGIIINYDSIDMENLACLAN